MNRYEYNQARRLIRANGRYAMRWMDAPVRAQMDQLLSIKDATDRLVQRAEIIAYCKRAGIPCNPRQTA